MGVWRTSLLLTCLVSTTCERLEGKSACDLFGFYNIWLGISYNKWDKDYTLLAAATLTIGFYYAPWQKLGVFFKVSGTPHRATVSVVFRTASP